MRVMLIVLVIITGLNLSACDQAIEKSKTATGIKTVNITALCDSTDSSQDIRKDERVRRFLKILSTKPGIKLEVFCMLPDGRIYPVVDLDRGLDTNTGIGKNMEYSGGNLQGALQLVEARQCDAIYVFSDGGNDYRLTPQATPVFRYPEKTVIIGCRPEFWSAYQQTGISVLTLEQMPLLLQKLASGSNLINTSEVQ